MLRIHVRLTARLWIPDKLARRRRAPKHRVCVVRACRRRQQLVVFVREEFLLYRQFHDMADFPETQAVEERQFARVNFLSHAVAAPVGEGCNLLDLWGRQLPNVYLTFEFWSGQTENVVQVLITRVVCAGGWLESASVVPTEIVSVVDSFIDRVPPCIL